MRSYQLIELLQANPHAYITVKVQTEEESYAHDLDKFEVDDDGDFSLVVLID